MSLSYDDGEDAKNDLIELMRDQDLNALAIKLLAHTARNNKSDFNILIIGIVAVCCRIVVSCLYFMLCCCAIVSY